MPTNRQKPTPLIPKGTQLACPTCGRVIVTAIPVRQATCSRNTRGVVHRTQIMTRVNDEREEL